MKKFLIQVDVTFSGNIEIEANTEAEAKALLKGETFVPSDIKNFWYLNSEVVDIEEVTE